MAAKAAMAARVREGGRGREGDEDLKKKVFFRCFSNRPIGLFLKLNKFSFAIQPLSFLNLHRGPPSFISQLNSPFATRPSPFLFLDQGPFLFKFFS